MKNILLILALLLVVPSFAVQAQGKKKSKKEVSPFIEGRQKVRKTDYDSVWKFTSFNPKLLYYCNFDYTQFPAIIEKNKKKPDWGEFQPVANYLAANSRAAFHVCAVYAINPKIDDPEIREQLKNTAQEEALESLQAYQEWANNMKLKNKMQLEVAQIDHRFWQGTDYFTTEQPQEAIIHVGLVIFFNNKKINLFPNAAEGAQKFKDVKFFPNDATVVESYNSLIYELVAYLQQNERFEVLLTGYSDNQGTEVYNKALSRQRAMEIKKMLLNQGIADYRIEIEAKGSADPIGDNKTYDGRQANNRVSIAIQ